MNTLAKIIKNTFKNMSQRYSTDLQLTLAQELPRISAYVGPEDVDKSDGENNPN